MSSPFQSLIYKWSPNFSLSKMGYMIGCCFLVLFPLSITSVPAFHGVIILFSALFYLFLGNGRVLNKDERFFIFSVVFMVVVAFLVSLYAGIDQLAMKKLFKFFYLLMTIPVFLFFRNVKPGSFLLWYGLSVGAVLSAVVAIFQAVFYLLQVLVYPF